MIVGGYSLDLYCDNEDKHIILDDGTYYFKPDTVAWIPIKHQFSNETYANCVKQAKKEGWLVYRNINKCLCKYCR
jgi:hypothetical protein